MANDEAKGRERRAAGRGRKDKPLWKSKIVLAAGAVTVIGLVMWVYALVTAPKASAAPGALDSSLVSGFGPQTPASAAGSEARARVIDRASPALLRFGASFIVGCILAYLFKKFIKLSLLIAALIAAGVFALHKTGVIDIDADAVRASVDKSLKWARGEASGFKDFVLGYLPSSASACAGLAYGAIKS